MTSTTKNTPFFSPEAIRELSEEIVLRIRECQLRHNNAWTEPGHMFVGTVIKNKLNIPTSKLAQEELERYLPLPKETK